MHVSLNHISPKQVGSLTAVSGPYFPITRILFKDAYRYFSSNPFSPVFGDYHKLSDTVPVLKSLHMFVYHNKPKQLIAIQIF